MQGSRSLAEVAAAWRDVDDTEMESCTVIHSGELQRYCSVKCLQLGLRECIWGTQWRPPTSLQHLKTDYQYAHSLSRQVVVNNSVFHRFTTRGDCVGGRYNFR